MSQTIPPWRSLPTVAAAGGLDVLINNAADELTAADAAAVYDTDVVGVMRTTQAFLPLFL
jgi:NAD(P)-dependent dehydrogenase (short-subunit alcohol dehydrogenase family)